jgi:hypothetical protein
MKKVIFAIFAAVLLAGCNKGGTSDQYNSGTGGGSSMSNSPSGGGSSTNSQ